MLSTDNIFLIPIDIFGMLHLLFIAVATVSIKINAATPFHNLIILFNFETNIKTLKMANTYSQSYFQLIFAVKNRNALIRKEWKDTKSENTRSC